MVKSQWMGLISFLGISCLLLACTSYRANSSDSSATKEPAIVTTADPNQSVSSDNAARSPITSAPKSMMIEGQIEQVMESFPLQLTVTTNSGRYFVSLQANTAIVQQGKTVAPTSLQPGTRVQISGRQAANAEMTLVAQNIQIQ